MLHLFVVERIFGPYKNRVNARSFRGLLSGGIRNASKGVGEKVRYLDDVALGAARKRRDLLHAALAVHIDQVAATQLRMRGQPLGALPRGFAVEIEAVVQFG